MFIDIDYNKKMKDYKIELSKPNKTIITNLSERIDARLSVGLGSIGELTFKIPYKIENDYHEIIDNPNIDLLKEKMYLRLTIGNQKMWFVVDNISDQTEDLDMMNVQAFSLPIELKNKKISELNLTSVNADMLMDELLVSSSWSKGTVDLELQSTYRTFDFSETTIYDALVSSAETFGAIIVWDEENKTISFRELTNISQYKGMSVNAEKFLNSLKRTRDTDEMVTRLYVYGNEKMSIQNVNPSGLKYIEDFSYFLEPFTRDANKNVLTHSAYMSDELCHAILDNKELKELALPQINTLQSEIIVLNSNLALKDIELTELKLSLATTKGLLDIAKSTGDTALIAQRQSEVINFETLVSTKTSEIGTITSQINTKTNEMTALQDSVSITSFTPELLDELDVYIVEKDFYDDRYIDETELYNAGINKFAEIRSPKIVVEISIDNLLNVVEEQYYWDKIVLGDMIQVKYPNMKINYKSTIVGLDFDLDEMDCSVKIANHTDNLDSIDKLVSIIYENQSTSLTISNNKYKWDSIIDVRDRVDQLRDGEIDAVKNRIKAGVNESVNIGDNGIVLTNPNFPEEMVIMQAGVIALTRDGGETWNTSITPRGVIAETIIGNLIAGNELVITNSNGTFVMDASGLTIDADNIFINSGDTQTPENLVEYWNSMSLTMSEFSNDNVINKYEKQQIKKQWDNIVSVHNSMIDKFYAEIGTETAENPYPVEYDIYMEKYEALNTYLNTTLQSDGFSILNALNADNTTTIDPLVYNTKFSEFSKAKDDFQIVIPMEYTKASISVLESGINLNYVKNNNVVAMINLSEEGVRIDGKLLTIDAETHFNNDLVMNAGVIKSADGGTVLDLNNNTFTFDKPFTIGVSNVATVEDVENIEMAYIASLSSDVAVISTDVNGNNGNFTDVDTSIHVFQRDIDVTALGWTFSAVASTGVTGTLTGNNYDVSGMSVDNGYVDITAKKDLINLTKRFSISKSRAGNTGANGGDGENAHLVFLNSTSQIFSKNVSGTISPNTITVNGTTQNTTITTWEYSVNGGAFSTSLPTGVTRSGNIVTLIGATITAKTIAVRAKDVDGISDTLSIALVVDGSNGASGADGENAIVGYLTNESSTLSANSAGTVANFTPASGIFKVYDGITDVTTNVNCVFSLNTSSNLTASITSSGAYSVSAMSEDTGTAEFKAVYNGVTILKTLTVAKSKTGATGATGLQGPTGANGTSVSSVTEYYLASSSATGITTESAGWTTTMQTMTESLKYLWNYEKINFSDTSSQNTIPVIIGTYGATGATGATGRSITGITEYYLASASSSGVTTATAGWTTTMQATDTTKRYLWNYEMISWSSAPTTTYVNPIIIGVHGATGATGPQGLQGLQGPTGSQGIAGTSSYTHIAYSTSSTGSTGFSTSDSVNKTYIGMYVDSTPTDSEVASSYNWTLIKGADGSQGIQGPTGPSGQTSYLHIAYATNATGTTGFSTTDSAGKTYIGQYTDFTSADSTNPALYSWTLVKGETGEQGLQGLQGLQGTQGIQGVSSYTHIAYSTSPTGATGFSTSNSSGATYIGMYVDSTATDSEVPATYNWTLIKGADGAQGIQGPTGANGQTSYLHIAYATNSTGTTGFSTTDSVAKTYIGQYTDFVSADSTNPALYSWTLIKGETGPQGPQGLQGLQGPTGSQGIQGPAGVSSYTHIAYATSSTGSTGFSTSDSVNKTYIGMYVDSNPTDSETPSSYNWTLIKGADGAQGIQGPTGANGQTSYLHIAYATNATGTTGFSTTDSVGKTYIGQYTDFTSADSTNASMYSWTLIKGDTGPQGLQGVQGLQGATGSQGIAGTSSYTHIAYSTSSTGSTGFSTSVSTGATYIGMYVDSNPTDSEVPSTYNWTLIKGADGSQGIQGPVGPSGQTSYLHIAYATNATGTTGFSTTDSTSKTYIGQYTDFISADSTNPALYSWTLIKGETGAQGATGAQGPTGATGTSVSGVVEYYLATSSASGVTTATSGWTTTIQTITTTNKYLWNYEKINFSNGSSQDTLPVIIGAYGETGATGSTGATGRSIVSIVEYYLATASATGVTRATSGWTTTMQTTDTTKRYLWNYETITWSSGTITTYVEPIIIGIHGPQGPQGPTGLQGLQGPTGSQGIQGPAGVSSYTHIAYATNATGTTGFSTSVSTGATYIGMYVDSNPTDSETPSAYAWTLIKGADGSQGIQGPAGSNGQTPYLHIAYATNATGTTGFSTTDSTSKTYIGTYTDFTSADSTNPALYSWTLIKGETGATGANGQNAVLGFLTNEAIILPSNSAGTVSSFTGATGTFEVYDGITRKTGTGITYSVFSSSNITVSINATTGVYSVTAMTTGTGVLSGTATLRAVYGSVTIDKILNVSKSLQGVQGSTGSTGATGASATSYWLTPSVNTVIKKMDGTLNPTSVLFSGYSKTGTSNPVTYSGRFIISTSTDGTNYTTRYTSASDQSSYTYTGIPTDSKFIKARFYQAGGTTILFDEQTIPVIETLDSIEIGGRNLIRTSYIQNRGCSTFTYNAETNTWQCVAPINSGSWGFGFVISSNGKILVDRGRTFLVSLEVKPAVNCTWETDINNTYVGNVGGNDNDNRALSKTSSKNLVAGVWNKVWFSYTANSTLDLIEANSNWGIVTGASSISFEMRNIQGELGIIPTAWTPAPEDVAYDIEQKADSSATSDAINDVASSAANAQSTANSKLDKSSYDNFINEYIDYKKAIASEQSASSKSLQDAKDAISLITNNMGDMKESWKFNNGTRIDATGDGMLLSDGTGGMNLLLSNNRISFFDSGVEVAYIADKTLKINHGIFVKSAQIGAHLISSSPSNPDITIVSWVGI